MPSKSFQSTKLAAFVYFCLFYKCFAGKICCFLLQALAPSATFQVNPTFSLCSSSVWVTHVWIPDSLSEGTQIKTVFIIPLRYYVALAHPLTENIYFSEAILCSEDSWILCILTFLQCFQSQPPHPWPSVKAPDHKSMLCSWHYLPWWQLVVFCDFVWSLGIPSFPL